MLLSIYGTICTKTIVPTLVLYFEFSYLIVMLFQSSQFILSCFFWHTRVFTTVLLVANIAKHMIILMICMYLYV